MSLVWINCFRKLKMEALDAAKEEKEIRAKELEKQKVKRKEKPFKEKMNRKVSFNSIVRLKTPKDPESTTSSGNSPDLTIMSRPMSEESSVWDDNESTAEVRRRHNKIQQRP